MKKIIAALVLLVAMTSCYHIEQNVDEVAGDLYLLTFVWNDTDIIWSEYDLIDQDGIDSIKCLRYKQASDVIVEIKRINNLKCN